MTLSEDALTLPVKPGWYARFQNVACLGPFLTYDDALAKVIYAGDGLPAPEAFIWFHGPRRREASTNE